MLVNLADGDAAPPLERVQGHASSRLHAFGGCPGRGDRRHERTLAAIRVHDIASRRAVDDVGGDRLDPGPELPSWSQPGCAIDRVVLCRQPGLEGLHSG